MILYDRRTHTSYKFVQHIKNIVIPQCMTFLRGKFFLFYFIYFKKSINQRVNITML